MSGRTRSGGERQKAAPQHLLGRRDDDEGIRIFGVNQCFELSDLRHGRGDHQYFAFLLCIHPPPMQRSGATPQILEDAIGKNLWPGRHDQREQLLAMPQLTPPLALACAIASFVRFERVP